MQNRSGWKQGIGKPDKVAGYLVQQSDINTDRVYDLVHEEDTGPVRPVGVDQDRKRGDCTLLALQQDRKYLTRV